VTVHRGRGQKLFQETAAPLWERYADHGGIRYAINAQHPLVNVLQGRLGEGDAATLGLLLEAVASSLPIEMIYSDYSTTPREVGRTAVDEVEHLERLRNLKMVLFGDGPGNADTFLQIVRSTRLFEGQTELAEKFVREAFA